MVSRWTEPRRIGTIPSRSVTSTIGNPDRAAQRPAPARGLSPRHAESTPVDHLQGDRHAGFEPGERDRPGAPHHVQVAEATLEVLAQPAEAAVEPLDPGHRRSVPALPHLGASENGQVAQRARHGLDGESEPLGDGTQSGRLPRSRTRTGPAAR